MNDHLPTGFLHRTLPNGRKYIVYVPAEVRPPYPALLFLHGRGESGTDGMLQLAVGLPLALMRNHARWPFLMVIPQKADGDQLWPSEKENINQALDWTAASWEIDPHRRYISGLSQGGNGTWVLAKSLSWQFAAAAPVCGWCDDLEHVKNSYHDLPIWAFHGGKDTVIPHEKSEAAVKAALEGGADAKLTIYPELGHNSWDEAYQASDLPNWLLSHHL